MIAGVTASKVEPEPAVPADAEPTRSLDRSFIRSLAWSGAGRWLTQLVSWPATIVIARMLTPEDYGIVVLVRVYMDFIAMVTEAGLGAAVTIAPEMDENRAGQLHTLSVALGGLAVLIACLMAVPLSNIYDRPGLEWVVFALSSAFIIESLAIVPNGLLRREFRYKVIAVADWARSLTDLAVELTMAFLGFGYWTLIAGQLAGMAAWVGVILSRRNLRFRRVRFDEVRATLRTMGHMVTQGLAGFAVTSSDVMIAGRLVSSAAVGAYSFGSQLAAIPANKITGLVANVTPSLFLRVANDPPLFRRYVLLITEALSILVLPAFIGTTLVAADFTAVVLGSKWSAVVVPLQLLALNAAVQSIFMVLPQVLWATENGRVVTRYGLVNVFVLPPLFFFLGRAYGINGIAAAWLIGAPVVALPRARVALRVIGLSAREYGRSLWPAFSGTAIMAVSVVAAQELARRLGWAPAPRLAASVIAGAASYAGAVYLLHRARIQNALATFRAVRQ